MGDDERRDANEDLVRDWRLDAIEKTQARVVQHIEDLEKAVAMEKFDLRYVLRDELRKRRSDGRDWTLRILLALVAVGALVEPILLAHRG